MLLALVASVVAIPAAQAQPAAPPADSAAPEPPKGDKPDAAKPDAAKPDAPKPDAAKPDAVPNEAPPGLPPFEERPPTAPGETAPGETLPPFEDKPPTTVPFSKPVPKAVDKPVDESDRLSWQVHTDSHVRLFQRSLYPGHVGAEQSEYTTVPLYQYASLRVADIDLPWAADSVDVQLSAWGNVHAGDTGDRCLSDADVTIASVSHRYGPLKVKLGRQIHVGGAARFLRFDGLSASATAPFGFGAVAYGGFAVLPRWSQLPGYALLGNVTELLRSGVSVPEPSREEYWLTGGRLHYALKSIGEIGASFHEQHRTGGLDRRNLGIDLRATIVEMIALNSQVTLDVDSWKPADIRTNVGIDPTKELSVLAEHRFSTPALFLSRQSVLSVFSSDSFNEAGASVRYQPVDWLRIGAAGYALLFSEGGPGMSAKLRARVRPLKNDSLVAQLGVTRLSEPNNGYIAFRGSAGYQVAEPLRLTAEGYLYRYDEPIRDESLSLVGTVNGALSFHDFWEVLLGGSAAQTPYSCTDLQGFLQVRFRFEGGEQ